MFTLRIIRTDGVVIDTESSSYAHLALIGNKAAESLMFADGLILHSDDMPHLPGAVKRQSEPESKPA